ncbi:hypothetical protein AB0E77_08805 [Streptomyces sp. NPDC032940]|uniref:hypothetical protein n=1 Tax=Streptomyces sp. NPDC032940 TaxID=3155366 RepID=UPI0033DB6542
MLDHRLVQTAVIGNSKSDHPVILPMEASELEAWRRRHPKYTYWCGYELGGCGAKLMDRLYRDKVCHFAHVAGGPTCGRAATGETSADHLFIKRGLRRLLDKQGQRGEVRTRDLGSGPGGAVDLHLPAARRRLRFQLSPLAYRGWRTANLDLGDDVDEVDWFFGTDGPLTKEILARNGYALRFRLETRGGERRVYIGTQTHGGPSVRWDPLEDCRIEQAGLLTPSGGGEPPLARRTEPFTFPLAGPLAFALDEGAVVTDGSPFASEGRRLAVADVRPAGSPIVRAVLSLPEDTPPPSAAHVYRVVDRASMLVREGGDGWAVRLDRFVRLDAREAARTGLTGLRLEPPEKEPTPAPRAVQPVRPSHVTPPSTVPSATPRKQRAKESAVVLTRDQAVVRAREVLTDAAAEGRPLRWSDLRAQLGKSIKGMSQRELVDFLVEVDSPLWDSKPVLSVLLLGDKGGLQPCLPRVLHQLGIAGAQGLSPDSPLLHAWVKQERERGIALYGTSPRAVPPRRPVTTPTRTLTAQQWRHVGASLRDVQQHKSKQERTTARHATAGERRQVRALYESVQAKMSVTGRPFRRTKRTNRVMRLAHTWLALTAEASENSANRSPEQAQALRTSAAEMLAELNAIMAELQAVKAQ